MKKLLVVALVTFMGAAQAASFEEGVEAAALAMQTGSYVCFSELRFTLEGYRARYSRSEIEEEFASNSEIHPKLVEFYRKGFQLNGLDDPALEVEFKKCIDREVRNVLKAIGK